jgi:hypothetical protein
VQGKCDSGGAFGASPFFLPALPMLRAMVVGEGDVAGLLRFL